MKKRTITLNVRNWKKLSPQKQRKAAKWLKELADHLVELKTSVSDEFTGIY